MDETRLRTWDEGLREPIDAVKAHLSGAGLTVSEESAYQRHDSFHVLLCETANTQAWLWLSLEWLSDHQDDAAAEIEEKGLAAQLTAPQTQKVIVHDKGTVDVQLREGEKR